jgi:signal transduction histidine kinase
MSFRVLVRLGVFAGIVALAIGAVAWSALRAARTLREMDELAGQLFGSIEWEARALAGMQEQYLSIARFLPGAIEELDGLLFAAVVNGDRAAAQQFERRSDEVRLWIAVSKTASAQPKLILREPVLFTASISELLEEVEGKYVGSYLGVARQLLGPATMTEEAGRRLEEYRKLGKISKELLALAGRAQAHGEAIGLFLAGSRDWSGRLRRIVTERIPMLQRLMVYASLVGVAGGCGLLVFLGYRVMVAPLRRRLREREAMLQKRQKLAHFGELAAGLAHEIGNPLTAINARLFALQRGLAHGTAEYEDAAEIRKEIERLERTVKGFLQLARPGEPSFVRMQAGPLLREVRDLMAAQLREASIELNIDRVTEAQFQGDPLQLKQVLINLVKNAADSIGRDGVVTLRARHGQFRLKGRSTEAVAIEVQDDGPGIAPEVQERLFDPFFSTKENGTGLGLSISARIVEAHGGNLQFETEPGRGTIFSVVLPVDDGRRQTESVGHRE